MRANPKLSRRDVLKILSVIPAAAAANTVHSALSKQATDTPNVLILVFDAWSARHVPFYGYPRRTMPNLEKFVDRATVYHRHYSAGTFTVPGTASLLTGLYPWSHRAFALRSSGVVEQHSGHQAFACFSKSHSTLGYAQNELADLFLHQFKSDLDAHVKMNEFQMERVSLNGPLIFPKDAHASFSSFSNNIFVYQNRGFDSSLLVGPAFRLWRLREQALNDLSYREQYPQGLPKSSDQFTLGSLVDGIQGVLDNIHTPTFAYLHMMPPHHPYAFTQPFKKRFQDGWLPPEKPVHELSAKRSLGGLNLQNEYYDEFLASWDAEFGRLFEFLHSSGLFDTSFIVLTSDHGELFERGELGHFTSLIYDPLIRIPLIITSPGQTERRDVYTATSSVDILPTLVHLTGASASDWSEGKLLPLLGGSEDTERSVYSIDAKSNFVYGPLQQFTLCLTKGDFRLTYYQYPSYMKFEFYNLKEDPEELDDLFPTQSTLALQMKEELLQKIAEVNRRFES